MVALAAGCLESTQPSDSSGPPDAITSNLRLNEIESSGGVPGDWVELFNIGAAPIDLSGYFFRDDNDERTFQIPVGTILAPGAFLVLDEADFGFGLGGADQARLFTPDGVLVDSYTWSNHAATTYGRCPDGTGEFVTTTVPTRGGANNCSSAVVLNEIESSGGDPGTWVELFNASPVAADLSGFIVGDSSDSNTYTLPAGSTIQGRGYLVLDEADLGFALGESDSARLFTPDGVLLDSYTWTTHAATTYGRCPNGIGEFVTTTTSTEGSWNACSGEVLTEAWPGGDGIEIVDAGEVFGGNLSGLTYEPSGSASRGVLWGVRNGPGSVFRLVWSGSVWSPDGTGEWGSGKLLRYPDGSGEPDAEGITLVGSDASRGLYVAAERNNSASGVSRNSILRFDAEGAGAILTATHEWNLTTLLPTTGANSGVEAVTWIPNEFLVARGLLDASTGRAYDPAMYPDHAGGLFFLGVEATGTIHALALDHSTAEATLVADIETGFAGVMGLEFDPELGYLWAACDDLCGGRFGILEVETSAADAQVGRFVVTRTFERPAGMPNLNNEGFALSSQAECTGGTKPVFWADDNETGGFALRAGSLACAPF